MKRRRIMRASRAIARVETQRSPSARQRITPDTDWLDSSLVSIDGLPPALAWPLGIATGIAAVVVLGWFSAPVGVALALPWLAVYLVRSAGVRPTGTARSPRSTPVALLSCAAIVAGMGIVGNVLSGFMPEDPPPAGDDPDYETGEPWSRVQEPGTPPPKIDLPPAPAPTSTTGEPAAATSTGELVTATTGEPDTTSATGQIPDKSYDPQPDQRPSSPERPSAPKRTNPKLCTQFKNRVTFNEDGTMSKRADRVISGVASRMKSMPTLEVRIVVYRKGAITSKPIQDNGEIVRERIMEATEVDARRLSIERRLGDGDWVGFEPANEECRDAR